jgi:tetratricopeptide (TPR) repeat protein
VSSITFLSGLLRGLLLVLTALTDSDNESFNKGKEALEKNDAKQAIVHLTQAIRKDPKNAEAYCLRGQAYYHESEYEKAESDLNSGIQLDDKLAEAFFWRGRVGRILGKQKEAVRDFTQALRLDSKNTLALADRAMTYYEMAEYAKTVSDFKQAVKLDPKWSAPHCWLATVLAVCPAAECRDGAGAIKYAEHACKLTVWKDFQSVEALAAGYAELGKFEEAVKWQKKALDIMKSKGFEAPRERAESRLKSYEMKKPARIKSFVLDW